MVLSTQNRYTNNTYDNEHNITYVYLLYLSSNDIKCKYPKIIFVIVLGLFFPTPALA